MSGHYRNLLVRVGSPAGPWVTLDRAAPEKPKDAMTKEFRGMD
jgi:hypothetical protein